MRGLFSLLFVIVLSSCNAVRVQYDYEKTTDFTNYTTYNYFSDLNTGLSALDTKRLLKSLNITLQSKGMLFSEEPDFYINIESNVYQTSNGNTVGVGVGGSGSSIGGGVSVGIPIGQPNIKREIIFDFVDNKKEMLFWQARSVDSFKDNTSPEKRELHLQELVNKVLDKYPPKVKKK
ncbi:DUF4136 domain-containing protein [Maribacter sp.]|uniref:DUF4136 domain-containing protein n=1 Tax=Maribacter sp. TaxID=1897614 RepID=UPI0025BBD8CA|nr:DUF4136 domain-containing protein [Maribacter sp.]